MRLKLLLCLVVGGASASLAVAAQGMNDRDWNVVLSRYDQTIGKLVEKNEKLQSDIRAVQRENEDLRKDVESANKRSQGVADSLQKMQNTDILNVKYQQKQINTDITDLKDKPAPWGDGQRDCAEILVHHQEMKLAISPDGSRGTRYLCFDGKVLHLGSELYALQ